MEHAEKVSMTNTLWLVSTFYRETETVKDELKTADDDLIQETKQSLSRIYNALERMQPNEAELFKERILSGEAFKGVCYGDALKLTEAEQAACDSFAENYF